MFSHRNACRCHDEGRAGADVESIRAVASGSAGVKQNGASSELERDRRFSHGQGKPCNFFSGFAAHPQSRQSRCKAGLRHFASHD